MTLKEVIEDSDVAEYIANSLASIKLYYHGNIITMSDKYFDCGVKED